MFNLFKKRRGKSAFNDNTQYLCIGVIYTAKNDLDYTVADKAKETLLANLQKRNDIFTRNEIEELSEVTQLDVWNEMVWVDDKKFTGQNPSSTVTEVQRWLGIRPEIDNKRIPHEKIATILRDKHFYSMQEIRNAAAMIGFDIYNASNWQRFSKITYHLNNDNGQPIVVHHKKLNQ